MIKELVKVANRLDFLGLQKEADIIDGMIRKMAVVSKMIAPSIDKSKISEFIEARIAKKEKEMERKQYWEKKYDISAIEYLKSFLDKAGQEVFVTTEDDYSYKLWLADPLDPKSEASPSTESGMSINLTAEELINTIGKDHFDYIKVPARRAGHIFAGVRGSGYGEWQFEGDRSQLDELGYTPYFGKK
jgi:hypothetical protein